VGIFGHVQKLVDVLHIVMTDSCNYYALKDRYWF